MRNLFFKAALLSVLIGANYDLFAQGSTGLKVVNYEVAPRQSGFRNSVYLSKNGLKMRAGNLVSQDGGKTWKTSAVKANNLNIISTDRFTPVTSVYDSNKNNLVSFYNVIENGNRGGILEREPKEGLTKYFLKYRVSTDNGDSWLFEKPVAQTNNQYQLFDGVAKGRNAMYIGDLGSIPIITKDGRILLPTESTLEGNGGGLANPGGGYTYMDVLVLIGSWNNDNTISWKSARVKANPEQTTRGLIEPTIAELNNGRILMVMRGSNGGKFDRNFQLPGYKWVSMSTDGGYNWSKPAPMTYDNGQPFYSPSSMSILFRHSSGRIFWAGNITDTNPQGDSPRYPLVLGEINQTNGTLIKSSIISLDDKKPSDAGKGKLDISHVTITEEKNSKKLILTYRRNYDNYSSTDWIRADVTVQ